MGDALRRGGSEVEPDAVGGGVWQRSGGAPEHLCGSEGARGGVGEGGAPERGEGAPREGSASREPCQALGAGTADGVRLRGEIDRRGEELRASEVLADHEDHVGGGDEDRAKHLDLA